MDTIVKKNNTLTWGSLKEKFKDIPDSTPIFYEDPNFGGFYWIDPELTDIKLYKHYNKEFILISFPFEDAVD